MSAAITATVLFTDLVASTELLSQVGEERAEELRREHFSVLRGSLPAHGGREVKNLGDGLMVVFDGITAALASAVAMQQAIDLGNRGRVEQLSIRVAVTHGEADVEDGDYFGIPVIEAARLCARASGDEILTTELVRLLAGTCGGFEFEPRGQMELKGLAAPVSASAVVWTREAPESVALPARLEAPEGSLLVGRAGELAMLSDSLKHATQGKRRRVTFVAGEAGIGKTTLVSAFARAASDEGALVLYGRCDEDLSVPYQPWVEALTHLLACSPDALVAAHVKERGGDLATLVPQLSVRFPDLPAGNASDPQTERHLLFVAVADLLARASANDPIVLVLDDLHWSDRPTLQLLRSVTGADSEMRLLVLGTFRDTDIGTDHPLTDLLAALHREEGVDRIALQGLDDQELLALLEAAAGHEMDDAGITLRDGLRAETNGNPFFTLEILRHLAETGAIAQADDGRWAANVDLRTHGLPVSVREVVGRRIGRLAPDATRVLSAAATIGRDFDVGLLAEVAETNEGDLLDLLDLAERADIVAEVPDERDRYTFVHALIQHTLYDDLSAARRRRLHHRVAEALESRVGGAGERVTELARHWYEATQPMDGRKAYQYSLAAGEQALEQLAPDEAVRWFTQALELVDGLEPGSDTERCDVLTRLGHAKRLAGDAGFRETFLEAAHLAEHVGDVDRLVGAALANSRGFFASAGEVDRDRVAVLNAALEAVGTTNGALRSQLLSRLSDESSFAPDIDCAALLDEALRLAREAGDDAALLTALGALHGYSLPHNLAARAVTEEYEAAAARADPIWIGYVAIDRLQFAFESGDAAAARVHAAEVDRVGAEVGDPTLLWQAGMISCWLAELPGNLEEAEGLAEAALNAGLDSGQPDAFAAYAAQLMQLRLVQGRIGEIIDLVCQAADENPGVPAFRAALSKCLADADRLDEARVILDEFANRGVASLPLDSVWPVCLAYLAQASASCDHRTSAAQLEPLLAPFRDQFVYGGGMMLGPIAAALAPLQAVLERWDDADASFAIALAGGERLGSPYWTAVTQLNWGRMLRRRDAAGDRERSDALLRSALDAAKMHGFGTVERRVGELLAF